MVASGLKVAHSNKPVTHILFCRRNGRLSPRNSFSTFFLARYPARKLVRHAALPKTRN